MKKNLKKASFYCKSEAISGLLFVNKVEDEQKNAEESQKKTLWLMTYSTKYKIIS